MQRPVLASGGNHRVSKQFSPLAESLVGGQFDGPTGRLEKRGLLDALARPGGGHWPKPR